MLALEVLLKKDGFSGQKTHGKEDFSFWTSWTLLIGAMVCSRSGRARACSLECKMGKVAKV